MPNWCHNELIIEGKAKEITAFKKKARSEYGPLSLDKLHKKPDGLKGTVAGVDNYNWYDWCLKNWGTKWDVIEATLAANGKDNMSYEFLSAWAPPVAWLRKVSKDYPGLEFTLRYDEPGVGFRGEARGKKGKVIDKDISC